MQIVIHVGHNIVIDGNIVDADWSEIKLPAGITHLSMDTDKNEGQLQFDNGLIMPITNAQIDVFKTCFAACENARSKKEAELRDLRIKENEELAVAIAAAQKRKLTRIAEFKALEDRVTKLETREKI